MTENNKNKRLCVNMAAQIIALLVNFGVSFFLTPIIVNKVGDNAYGFVGLANDFVSYAQIITVALNSMAGRFITISIHQNDFENANQYFSSVFFANLIMSLLFTFIGAIIICFLPEIIEIPNILVNDVRLLFIFVILNFLLGIVTSVFGISTFANNKLYLQSKRKIESYLIKTAILIFTYKFFRAKLWYVGIATLLATIYSSVIDIYYTTKFFPNLKILKENFQITKIKKLLLSGIWNSLSKLSSLLSNGLDLIISNKFVGSLGMSFLSLSKNLPVMIISVFSLLASVFSPDLTISYAKKDYNNIKLQLIKSIKILSVFACIPVTFLFVYGLEFYKLWIPNTNCELVYILSILASMGMIISLPFEGLWNIFTVTNKVKNSSLMLIINSVATILIVFILLPMFKGDMEAQLCIIAGVSSTFSIIRNLTFLPIYGAVCIHERKTIFYPVLFKYIISLILTMIVGFGIKILFTPTSWLSLILCFGVTSLLSLIISYLVLLTKDEKNLIFNKITNKKRKKS